MEYVHDEADHEMKDEHRGAKVEALLRSFRDINDDGYPTASREDWRADMMQQVSASSTTMR